MPSDDARDLTGRLGPYLGAAAHPHSAAGAYEPYFINPALFTSTREHIRRSTPDRVFEFNSLGFRGPDYRPDAALRVFVCGCSYTFGLGVQLDRTWPVVFTRLAAAALGIPIEQSHVQNFSQIGASNNYVARTIVKQCHRAPPTLAIAAFTHANRTEYLDGQQIRNLGHWDLRLDEACPTRRDSPGWRFFRQYSYRAGLQNVLANMVLFQSAMEQRGVPYITVYVDVDDLRRARTRSSPGLRDYDAVLDKSRISRLSLNQPGIHVDTSEAHPGPQSHERFAAALAKEFEGRLLTRRPFTQGGDAVQTLDLGRPCKRPSADRLVRCAIRVVARQRPRSMRVVFDDNLAVEHWTDNGPVEIDLERRAWTIAGARLRAAYADYITADLLRFNFLMNVLRAQEYMLARGCRPDISLPACWFPGPTDRSPVLTELSGLVGDASVSLVVRRTRSRAEGLDTRLDAAKRRLRRSAIDALLRRVARPKRTGPEDPNIYPFW